MIIPAFLSGVFAGLWIAGTINPSTCLAAMIGTWFAYGLVWAGRRPTPKPDIHNNPKKIIWHD